MADDVEKSLKMKVVYVNLPMWVIDRLEKQAKMMNVPISVLVRFILASVVSDEEIVAVHVSGRGGIVPMKKSQLNRILKENSMLKEMLQDMYKKYMSLSRNVGRPPKLGEKLNEILKRLDRIERKLEEVK